MKALSELEQKLKDLGTALKLGNITVNEYSTFYYNTAQKIKTLNKGKKPNQTKKQ